MRKGPEHVPDSILVLVVALGLFALAMVMSETLIITTGNSVLIESIYVSFGGYILYWIVLLATGFAQRLLPTISCIMACGSILTIARVVLFVILAPLLGVNTASLIAWLMLIWSVPVKGHIISRAIGMHWYIGISVALVIYLLQQIAYDALTKVPVG